MLKFDKTVNLLLNRLVFEQDETNIDQENTEETPEETDAIQTSEEKQLAAIEDKYEKEGNSFLSESEARYKSGEEYVNHFIENAQKRLSSFTNSRENVSESALTDDLVKFKDYAASKGKKFLDAISPAQEKLADMTVNNIGKISDYALGREFSKYLNDNLSESFLYKAVAIFLDPTGIMSWPYLKKATDEYEKHKGTEDEAIYQLNLLAAQISVIPNFAFKPIFGILSLPFRLAFGGGAKIAEKIFGVTGTRKVARGLSNWLKKLLPFIPRAATLADRVVSNVPKVVKGALSTIPKVVKGAPIIASGNIPKFLEDLQSRGEKVAKTAGSKVGTLGRFPRFGEISTQRP
jgi:hypothetical protein